MQILNEDTYIGDTLVTCGQYQIFIDEMRAAGEYYQPDHWTSYQFPTGQDEWPILGLRHADARTYCQWLSEREVGEWSYRLPTKEEATNSPPVSLAQSPLCYWLSKQYQFAWVSAALKDPRGIGPFRYKFARDLRFEDVRDLTTRLAIDLDGALAFDLDRVLAHARALALDRTVVRARLLASALAPALTRAFDRTRDLNLSRRRALDRVRDLARARALSLALARVPDRSRAPDRGLQLAFDLYVDILTLQERIAGRSPAFEGILIVRERRKQGAAK